MPSLNHCNNMCIVRSLTIIVECPSLCPLGPSIKDVRRDGGGGLVKCGHMRTEEGVKDLADVRKLVLFFIVSACFADILSEDDAY